MIPGGCGIGIQFLRKPLCGVGDNLGFVPEKLHPAGPLDGGYVDKFLCFFVVVMQTLCTDHFREGEIAALFNAEAAEGGICYACHRRKQHGYAAACIAAKYF